MKKKVAVTFIFLLLFTSFCYAVPDFATTLNSADKNGVRYLDYPLVTGIVQFGKMISGFQNMAVTLISVFAFFNILFNAFKLWAGTTELKKVYVDIIYKSVLCIFLLQFYIPITDSLVGLATRIGATASDGYENINTTYLKTYKILLDYAKEGIPVIQQNLLKAAVEGENGVKYLDEAMLKTVATAQYTEDDFKKWAEQQGITIISKQPNKESDFKEALEKAENFDELPVDAWFTTDKKGNITGMQHYEDSNHNTVSTNIKKWYGFAHLDVNMGKSETKFNKSKDIKEHKKLTNKINALLEVIEGEDIGDKDEEQLNDWETAKNSVTGKLQKLFFNPYLKDKNGVVTDYLSASAMVKTCTLMADLIAMANEYDAREDEKAKKESMDKIKGSSDDINDYNNNPADKKIYNPMGEWGWNSIFRMLQNIIYCFGTTVCVIIVMCEYSMTILEYYIVTSIGIILVPLLFLDATKSYAQNIMKIWMNFFIKIMITVMVVFFTLSMYLANATGTYSHSDVTTSFSLVTYMMLLALGLFLCTGAPKFASTVMSGQPSMGFGTLAQGIRGALQTAHSAAHVAESAGRFAKGVGKMGQGAVRGGMDTVASFGSAIKAGMNTTKALKDDIAKGKVDMSGAGAVGAGVLTGLKSVGSSIGRGLQGGVHKALTGQDKVFTDKNGKIDENRQRLSVGQSFRGEDGIERKATFADVMRRNDKINGNKSANDYVKTAEKKTPVSGDQLSGKMEKAFSNKHETMAESDRELYR